MSADEGLETGAEDPLTYDLAVYDLDNLSGGTTPDEETTYSILIPQQTASMAHFQPQ